MAVQKSRQIKQLQEDRQEDQKIQQVGELNKQLQKENKELLKISEEQAMQILLLLKQV